MSDIHFDSIDETNDRIQRALNESKKETLKDEFGMVHSYVNPDLEPELESDFQNYIEQWERAYAVAQQTTVWEFLGKPEIKPMASLSIEEMRAELDRIYAIMDENEMALNCINPIRVDELYEFVSGQFMKQECSDMRIPGMTHRFIYEEFFPEKYPFDDSEYEGLNSETSPSPK
jgi:hypothetical protein